MKEYNLINWDKRKEELKAYFWKHTILGERIADGIIPEIIVQEQEIFKQLEEQNKQMFEAAKSFQELNICYRLGKRPSEKLFNKLEKANKFIDSITRKKIEEKQAGNTIPCLGDDLPY